MAFRKKRSGTINRETALMNAQNRADSIMRSKGYY